ncbi:hypothetical protein LJC02_01880 [Breznakia sp. OttesenSCG-928-G09]|nr:hypothetical protein [Breznakia sp. OttesenSCG-928-G09]
MYADYGFYTDTYKGNLLTAENFETYSVRAKTYIDYITLKKAIKGFSNPFIKDDISMCACALAEQYYKYDEELKNLKLIKDKIANGEVVSSETLGKQSVSYQKIDVDKRTESDYKKENDKLIKCIVNQYLSLTGLLYRGIVCL